MKCLICGKELSIVAHLNIDHERDKEFPHYTDFFTYLLLKKIEEQKLKIDLSEDSNFDIGENVTGFLFSSNGITDRISMKHTSWRALKICLPCLKRIFLAEREVKEKVEFT